MRAAVRAQTEPSTALGRWLMAPGNDEVVTGKKMPGYMENRWLAKTTTGVKPSRSPHDETRNRGNRCTLGSIIFANENYSQITTCVPGQSCAAAPAARTVAPRRAAVARWSRSRRRRWLPDCVPICHACGVRWLRLAVRITDGAPAAWQPPCICRLVLPSLRYARYSSNGIGPSS